MAGFRQFWDLGQQVGETNLCRPNGIERARNAKEIDIYPIAVAMGDLSKATDKGRAFYRQSVEQFKAMRVGSLVAIQNTDSVEFTIAKVIGLVEVTNPYENRLKGYGGVTARVAVPVGRWRIGQPTAQQSQYLATPDATGYGVSNHWKVYWIKSGTNGMKRFEEKIEVKAKPKK